MRQRVPATIVDVKHKAVSKQSLPRFNRSFRVPARCPETTFRAVEPGLRLELILCFKHRRRVSGDNTVKFYRHTLQLLPGQQPRSHAEAVFVVFQRLDGRLLLRHEGGIIAFQDALPGPEALRNGTGPSAGVTSPSLDPNALADSTAMIPEPLKEKLAACPRNNVLS